MFFVMGGKYENTHIRILEKVLKITQLKGRKPLFFSAMTAIFRAFNHSSYSAKLHAASICLESYKYDWIVMFQR